MTVLVGSLVGGVVIFGGVTVDTGLVGGGDALDVKTNLQSVYYIVCFCGSDVFTIGDCTGCSLICTGFDLICVYYRENHF